MAGCNTGSVLAVNKIKVGSTQSSNIKVGSSNVKYIRKGSSDVIFDRRTVYIGTTSGNASISAAGGTVDVSNYFTIFCYTYNGINNFQQNETWSTLPYSTSHNTTISQNTSTSSRNVSCTIYPLVTNYVGSTSSPTTYTLTFNQSGASSTRDVTINVSLTFSFNNSNSRWRQVGGDLYLFLDSSSYPPCYGQATGHVWMDDTLGTYNCEVTGSFTIHGLQMAATPIILRLSVDVPVRCSMDPYSGNAQWGFGSMWDIRPADGASTGCNWTVPANVTSASLTGYAITWEIS